MFRQVEVPLYGSDRVGQWSGGVEVARELFRKADFSSVSFSVDPLMRKSELSNPVAATTKQTVFGQDQEQVVAQESELVTVDAKAGSLSPLVSFAGKVENNVTVAEDSKGEVKFYAATASYWGADNVQLLFDKGGKLLKDSRSTIAVVPSDAKARSVAAVDMQEPSSYYLFSRGTDGKVYYQKINTGAVGFGSPEEPMGEITSSGEITGSGYGRNMAVVEDKVGARSLLYLTAYDPASGQNKLLRVTLKGGTVSEPEELVHYASHDIEGQGQLQVSQQGRELVVYNHLSKLGWYDHKEAELLRFSLDEDYKPLTGTAKTTPITAGNLAKGSVHYSRDGKFLYYAQEALVLLPGMNTNQAVVKQGLEGELASASQVISTNSKGDISLSEGTFLSFGESTTTGKLWQEQNLVSKLLPDLPAPVGSAFVGALSYAPHRVEAYNGLEGVLVRQVGQKDYELKDHLGNVRVLVSDRKEWSNNILSAAVRGYYHYYPFGMHMPQLFFPGNTTDNGGYRYGYNGQEKDDEFKGGGNSYDFAFRIYDPRLGRFMSLDPLASRYPHSSPYAFAENDVIRSVDIEGLEKVIVIYSPWITKEIRKVQKIRGDVNNNVLKWVRQAMKDPFNDTYYLRKFDGLSSKLPTPGKSAGVMYDSPNTKGIAIYGVADVYQDKDGRRVLKMYYIGTVQTQEQADQIQKQLPFGFRFTGPGGGSGEGLPSAKGGNSFEIPEIVYQVVLRWLKGPGVDKVKLEPDPRDVINRTMDQVQKIEEAESSGGTNNTANTTAKPDTVFRSTLHNGSTGEIKQGIEVKQEDGSYKKDTITIGKF